LYAERSSGLSIVPWLTWIGDNIEIKSEFAGAALGLLCLREEYQRYFSPSCQGVFPIRSPEEQKTMVWHFSFDRSSIYLKILWLLGRNVFPGGGVGAETAPLPAPPAIVFHSKRKRAPGEGSRTPISGRLFFSVRIE